MNIRHCIKKRLPTISNLNINFNSFLSIHLPSINFPQELCKLSKFVDVTNKCSFEDTDQVHDIN